MQLMFATSKITPKGQTTIPRTIRIALNVAPGDSIAWEISNAGVASVRHVQALDIKYLQALEESLSEWAGTSDEEAYREL